MRWVARMPEPRSALRYICFVSRQEQTAERRADGRSRQRFCIFQKNRLSQNILYRPDTYADTDCLAFICLEF